MVGRLTRDPESQTIGDNKVRTVFTLAVDRNYKKKDEKAVDFVTIVTWGRLAMTGAKYLRKGMPVLVNGRLQVRPYEKENEKRWFTEIVADTFQILDTVRKDTVKEAA